MKNAIAIDLGSTNTYIYQSGVGIVLDEPTMVAISTDKNKVVAVGEKAKNLYGLAVENTTVVYPIFEGCVQNEYALVQMLIAYLKKVEYSGQLIVLSVPCGIEKENLIAFERAFNKAGAYKIVFVESPICSALGMGILSDSNAPRFVVNIGGGTTNISAVSKNGIIAGVCINLGGQNIDSMLVKHIEKNVKLKIGMLTSEKLKNQLASLYDGDELRHVVSGRDMELGRPRPVSIGAEDILQPMKVFFDIILNVIERLITKLPPEVLAEINRTGIYVTGGVSKLCGLGEYFEKELKMRVNVVDNGEYSNVLGAGLLAGNKDLLKLYKLDK